MISNLLICLMLMQYSASTFKLSFAHSGTESGLFTITDLKLVIDFDVFLYLDLGGGFHQIVGSKCNVPCPDEGNALHVDSRKIEGNRADANYQLWETTEKRSTLYSLTENNPGNRFGVTEGPEILNKDNLSILLEDRQEIKQNEPQQSVDSIPAEMYWKNWWFKLASAFLLISVSGLIIQQYYYRKHHKLLDVIKEQEVLRKSRNEIRANIARDFHDDISSSLGSIALYAESLKRLGNSDANSTRILNKIESLCAEVTEKIGDIIWTISPKNDSLTSLIFRIKNFAHELSDQTGIQYRVNLADTTTRDFLEDHVRKNLYLICKEILWNSKKHACATEVVLEGEFTDKGFWIEIRDNGKGFEPSREYILSKVQENGLGKGCFGLENIRFRADEIGAKISIDSAPYQGTSVSVFKKIA